MHRDDVDPIRMLVTEGWILVALAAAFAGLAAGFQALGARSWVQVAMALAAFSLLAGIAMLVLVR